jgi:hypothetical protein
MTMEVEEGRQHIEGWLGVKLRTGRCSRLFVTQLAYAYVNRLIHVHCVFDEIGYIEDPSCHRPTGTKPATRFQNEPLRGLWHKHWFEARFLKKNLENFAIKAAGPIFERMFDAINRGEYPAQCVHELVFGGHESWEGRRTGEWIVFAEVDDVKYYLTLGTHTEGDAAVFERVKACAVEFPEIMVQS